MNTNTNTSTTIVVRCSPQLKEAAKKAAKAENRTLSNFAETLLQERIYGTPSRPDIAIQPKEEEEVDIKNPLSNMKHNF